MSRVAAVVDFPTAKRCFVALGLLLGLLLMHGVAADHDMPVAAGASNTASVHGIADNAGIGDTIVVVPLTEVVVLPMPSHSMATLCVAILSGGLLLLPLLGLRIKRRHADPFFSTTARFLMKGAASTQWLTPPALTRLCVSRT